VNPNIYLHEVIRTVPGREESYLASVLSLHHDPTRSGLGHPAFAQFRSVATSGPWPVGINIWENTWAGQTADLMSQFQDAKRDTAMEDWWNRNLHLRRGGYDRILIPADYSPTLADLEARSVRGEVFLQEIMWLPFGEPRRYLDAVESQLLPILDRLGLDLVGAFRVAMRPRQVLTLIGAPEWSRLAALMASSDDPNVARWNEYRVNTVQQAEEMLLLPARHGPLVPRG
jgi:hypothetical protein